MLDRQKALRAGGSRRERRGVPAHLRVVLASAVRADPVAELLPGVPRNVRFDFVPVALIVTDVLAETAYGHDLFEAVDRTGRRFQLLHQPVALLLRLLPLGDVEDYAAPYRLRIEYRAAGHRGQLNPFGSSPRQQDAHLGSKEAAAAVCLEILLLEALQILGVNHLPEYAGRIDDGLGFELEDIPAL